MNLLKLNISNFGCLHNKTIDLSKGLNLIYGENEAGKSTIHAFIKGMLFGIEKKRGRSSANDIYDKYEPWDNPGSYDGSLEFIVDGEEYHLYRNFNKNNKVTILTQIKTGRELKFDQLEFQDLIGGIDQSGYDGTISIGQLQAKTDRELVYIVQNYITNLTTSKSLEIDVKKALGNLKGNLKSYNIKALNEEIKDLEEAIKEGELTEDRLEDLSKQMKDIKSEEIKLIEEKDTLINNKYYSQDELSSLFMKFSVIKTKYGYYLDRLDQGRDLQEQIALTEENIYSKSPDIQNQVTSIKSSIKDIDIYKQEYSKLSQEKADFKSEEEEGLEIRRRLNLNISSPFFVLGIVLALLSYSKNSSIFTIGIAVAVIGVIIFTVLNLIYKNKKNDLQLKEESFDEELTNIGESLIQILNIYSVKSESELSEKYEEALKEEISLNQLKKDLEKYKNEYLLLQEKTATLKSEVLDYISKFKYIYPNNLDNNLELNDDVIGILDEYIIDERLKQKDYEENIKPKLRDLSIKKEKLKWELELLENNEEKLLDNQKKYQELLDKQNHYEEEIESINLATNTIQNLATGIHDTFGQELNNLVSDKVRDITGGRYEDIKVNEKLDIKTHIGNQYHNLEKLSVGTIEQIYFSMRLSIADIIYGSGGVPILLDDTFAYYDDTRLRATLEMLLKEEKRQILLFTCHSREKEILDDLGAEYGYIKL